MFPSPHCIPNTSWKFVDLLVKHLGIMSLECRRNVGSALHQKMRTPSLLSLSDYFRSLFRTAFEVKHLTKLFSVIVTCCCLSVSYHHVFLVLLLTITRKGDISTITFLYYFEFSLHSLHFFEVC